MDYWILLTAILSSYLCVCHELNQNETKLYELVENRTIKDIIMKICDITINNFAHEPPNKKQEILKKLEKKVKAASKGFDSVSHRYEKLILEGIKMMSESNDYKSCKVDMKKLFQGNKTIVQHNDTSINAIRRNYDNNLLKLSLIDKMKEKIQKLVKKALRSALTSEEKEKILDHMKKRIIEKVKLRAKKSKANKNVYKDLLVQGIKLFGKEIVINDSKRRSIKQVANIDGAEEIGVTEEMYATNFENSETGGKTGSSTIYPMLESLTTEYSCENVVKRTCLDLLRIKEHKCSYKDSIIPFEKICDSNVDCPDGSDEQDCTTLVIQRVQKSTRLISTIELSAHCFSELDNSLLSRQGAMLTSLLNTEVAFIEKFSSGVTPAYKSIIGDRKPTAREMANEVAGIIKTFSEALSGSLCLNVSEVIDAAVFRFSESLDVDKEFEEPIPDFQLTPKSCECREQYCANDSCVSFCQRICFQKYSLGRWGCQAISKGASVSLDVVCDAKIDCYDESDETSCAGDNTTAAAKFEASTYFDNILKEVTKKTATEELAPVRNKLILLHSAVKTIQKRSIKPKVQKKVFKILRDKCFSVLSSIFTDIVNKINNMDAIEEYYAFLMSVNNKFIGALKRTHTGNRKIVSSEGCICRGVECAMPKCSKTCVRTCAAKPILTRYPCVSSSSSNITSVSINDICNGKADCPKKDDEINCKDEICRSHHAVLLRRSLQNVDKYKGRILEEELSSWRAKVTNYLVVFESKKERPTPKTLRKAVSGILHDLLQTYTSMEQFRRVNDGDVLKKLTNLSKRVQDVLKSCGK